MEELDVSSIRRDLRDLARDPRDPDEAEDVTQRANDSIDEIVEALEAKVSALVAFKEKLAAIENTANELADAQRAYADAIEAALTGLSRLED